MTNRATRWRRAGLVTTIAASTLIFASCGGGTGTGAPAAESEPTDGGTITVAIESDPASQFDVHVSGADVAALVLRNVFDSLVVQDPDGTIQPWLAESWDISDDGLEYTFHLREGVTFHDGEPFDAAAVKANFDRVVDPDTKSQYAAALLGGDAYKETEVIDSQTVVVRLNRPFSPLLQGLSTTYLGFYSPAILESSADKLAAGGADVTVGTGPFILESYVDGQSITFTKNPDYDWAPENATHSGPAHPDKLVYRILPEQGVRAGALTSGEVDVAGNLSPDDLPTIEADDSISVNRTNAPGLPYSIFLNHSEGVFTDPLVRRAVQRGIDITSTVDAVYDGQYDRAWSVLGPTTPSYDPTVEGTWEFDQELAAELLDEAGWTETDSDGYRTKDGDRLSATWIVSNQREDRASLGAAFQADLKEIGFELTIEQLDIGAYLERLQQGAYDAVDWSFVRSDGDILRLHLYSDFAPIQNASFVDDPQVDDWVLAASQTTDDEERAALYAKVQQWAVEDAAIIPVYIPGNLTGVSSAIGGVRADISGWPLLYDAWTTNAP